MGGYVGFLDSNVALDRKKILGDMLDAIIHRGPNNAKMYDDNTAALGFRSLNVPTYSWGSFFSVV